uniref:L-type lectin-like domain-containing protein n=1 Tax=Eptatretus burgeri TaxID=7764 RepID=A0A8C4QYW1_EPTBU
MVHVRGHAHAFLWSPAGSSERALWDIIGSTMVTSQQVRLTPDQQSKQGAIWNRVVRLMQMRHDRT